MTGKIDFKNEPFVNNIITYCKKQKTNNLYKFLRNYKYFNRGDEISKYFTHFVIVCIKSNNKECLKILLENFSPIIYSDSLIYYFIISLKLNNTNIANFFLLKYKNEIKKQYLKEEKLYCKKLYSLLFKKIKEKENNVVEFINNLQENGHINLNQ
jgi:hypothetical protein